MKMTTANPAKAGAQHGSAQGHAGMARIAATGGSGDMMVDAHRALLWPHYLSLMLGVWLVASPFTLGYLNEFIPNASLLRVPFQNRKGEKSAFYVEFCAKSRLKTLQAGQTSDFHSLDGQI